MRFRGSCLYQSLSLIDDRVELARLGHVVRIDKEQTLNSMKRNARPRLILVSLLAAFIAVMSTSMAAGAVGLEVEKAAPAPVDGASSDSEDVRSDADSDACDPNGTACTIFNDTCCGTCQPLVGHAGRCV